MFVLQNSPMPNFKLPHVTMRRFDFHSQTSKFDLTLTLEERDAFVYDKEQAFIGSMEYSTDLFDRSTVERMLGHYETLMQAAVANPDLHLSQLPLLTPDERQRLLTEWNATEQPASDDVRLSDLFRAQLARSPDAIALRYEGQAISFRD